MWLVLIDEDFIFLFFVQSTDNFRYNTIIIKPAKNNISVSMESDVGSNTNIDVDVMSETSTDSRPNLPKS